MFVTRERLILAAAVALAAGACNQPPTESPSESSAPPLVTATPTATPEADESVATAPDPQPRARGWRWRATARDFPVHAGWRFDPAAVESVDGRVREVVLTPGRGPRGGGVHLVVETEAGPLTVALGPAWYVERQEPAIVAGDAVRVVGARIDEGFVVGVEVRKGDDVLVLRDADGIPRWRGWRRGPRG